MTDREIFSAVANFSVATANPAFYACEYIMVMCCSHMSLDEQLQSSYEKEYIFKQAMATQNDVGL